MRLPQKSSSVLRGLTVAVATTQRQMTSLAPSLGVQASTTFELLSRPSRHSIHLAPDRPWRRLRLYAVRPVPTSGCTCRSLLRAAHTRAAFDARARTQLCTGLQPRRLQPFSRRRTHLRANPAHECVTDATFMQGLPTARPHGYFPDRSSRRFADGPRVVATASAARRTFGRG
jgi:hypothetical protein